MSEVEGIEWAKRSIDFAFNCGVECCAIIPTRAGNGAMENLEQKGFFQSPRISSIEEVLDYGINLKKGRVFADLWDLEQFSICDSCLDARKKRLNKQNMHQIVTPGIKCQCTQPG